MNSVPEDHSARDGVCCAYDGSVNGHWVARYAIRFAAATDERRLRLVHVEDRHVSPALMERKLEHVLADCNEAGVTASVHSVRATGDVADAILSAVPSAPDTIVLCGTRARPRRAYFLKGTVSATLLARAHCDVLALRVVSPGLLGAPRRLLLPLAGRIGEGRDAARFVRPFAAGLQELHLLRVVLATDHVARHASPQALARLREAGRLSVARAERELRAAVDTGDAYVDGYVRVAESWARLALVLAGQHRCGLVLVRSPSRRDARAQRELETLLANAPCDVGLYRSAS